MTDKKLLASKMVAYGDTVDELCKVLNVTRPTFINKRNSKLGFKQEEIYIIKERYNLSPDDLITIFFKE